MRIRRTQRGFVAGGEALVFGVLIFVIGSLIFLNAWAVIDAKFAVAAAAREAARAYAEANDPDTAMNQAQQASDDALVGYHRNASLAKMTIDNQHYERCAQFTVTVRYPINFVLIPMLANHVSRVNVQGQFQDTVDPFRSGLPGSANC